MMTDFHFCSVQNTQFKRPSETIEVTPARSLFFFLDSRFLREQYNRSDLDMRTHIKKWWETDEKKDWESEWKEEDLTRQPWRIYPSSTLHSGLLLKTERCGFSTGSTLPTAFVHYHRSWIITVITVIIWLKYNSKLRATIFVF